MSGSIPKTMHGEYIWTHSIAKAKLRSLHTVGKLLMQHSPHLANKMHFSLCNILLYTRTLEHGVITSHTTWKIRLEKVFNSAWKPSFWIPFRKCFGCVDFFCFSTDKLVPKQREKVKYEREKLAGSGD
jgi:hypothetical protein